MAILMEQNIRHIGTYHYLGYHYLFYVINKHLSCGTEFNDLEWIIICEKN